MFCIIVMIILRMETFVFGFLPTEYMRQQANADPKAPKKCATM